MSRRNNLILLFILDLVLLSLKYFQLLSSIANIVLMISIIRWPAHGAVYSSVTHFPPSCSGGARIPTSNHAHSPPFPPSPPPFVSYLLVLLYHYGRFVTFLSGNNEGSVFFSSPFDGRCHSQLKLEFSGLSWCGVSGEPPFSSFFLLCFYFYGTTRQCERSHFSAPLQ